MPTVGRLVPLEDWAYGAVERLSALGYVDTAFLGLRPWSRSEFARLAEEADDHASSSDDPPAYVLELVNALRAEFAPELRTAAMQRIQLEYVYVRGLAIAGAPLTDGYHFGQTLTSDQGRPYARGFNSVIGASTSAQLGNFSFSLRGEFQHAPAPTSVSDSVRSVIATADGLPVQPAGASESVNRFRLLDANVSTVLGGLQFTVGKQSFWWGTGESGAMLLSDNAEPFYALRISRPSPVQLPSIFAYLGPMRFDSFFGKLEGHSFPPSPYFYGQKISLKPIPDLEIGFSRTVVFAGQGVTPLTFSTFFHSFLSTSSGTAPGFDLRHNPGARHAAFDFSYRLPGLRRWGVSLYSDSLVHDDVSPVSAPRRAAINPGIYIAKLPMLPKLEFRAEAVSTDPPVARSIGGKFFYWEGIYRDAYINNGNLMGNWVGREGKGGQAWLAYSAGPQRRFELSYRRAKLAKDFIPGGGTQNNVRFASDWLLRPSVQARASLQYEHWMIPALAAGPRSDVVAGFELRWLNIGKVLRKP